MNTAALQAAGRMLVALAFIGPGLTHLWGSLQKHGEPSAVGIALVEAVAGLALALDQQVKVLAVMLIVFLAVDGVVSHPFWSGPSLLQSGQALHFFKNLAIVGGLLLVWIKG